jgi:hypothetical protein
MQDGAIKHDECTKLGEVGRYARSVMYAVPETTEEDDLAGVSVLMSALGHREAPKTKKKPAARKKSPRKTARKKPTKQVKV